MFELTTSVYWILLFQYFDLFLTRADGLRRRLSFTGEVGDYSIIRETFQVPDQQNGFVQSLSLSLSLNLNFWASQRPVGWVTDVTSIHVEQ